MTALRLHIPDGHKKPDEFYEQVAARWTILTIWQHSRRPANEMAEANGVPVSTVHRWVREARRRGILSPQGLMERCYTCGQVLDGDAVAHKRGKRRAQKERMTA